MPSLDFKGKSFIYTHHLGVPYRELLVVPEKSCPPEGRQPDLDDNLILHGDNLEALKALLPRYAGKVDCIYIDPPYNTGAEGWCYSDAVNAPLMREWLKKSANPVEREDLQRHDKWLCMIWPRLQLLKELLAEDGTIFVSIDDNEVHRLRAVMDEIFGEENLVESFIWKKSYGGGAKEKYGVRQHEYVLMYSMHKEDLDELWLPPDEDAEARYYKYKDAKFEKRGPYRLKPLEATKSMDDRANLIFPIRGPGGVEVLPRRQWWWSRTRVELALENDEIVFTNAEGGFSVSYKQYLMDETGAKRGAKPFSIIDGIYNQHGSEMLAQIFGRDKPFNFPKPYELIEKLLLIHGKKDSLILDSFAGSGTTAHAVLALNARDRGNRKFILCEMEDYADRLTAERVRRVIHGYDYTGTAETELHPPEKVTWSTFGKDKARNAILERIEGIENLERSNYDKIDKKITDGVLTIVGQKQVTEKMPGVGGSFTYVELGEAMDLERLLAETPGTLPGFPALARYLFFTATGHALASTEKLATPVPASKAKGKGRGTPAPEAAPSDDPVLIGETAVWRIYLHYRPDETWLRSPAAAFTRTQAEAIAAARDKEANGKQVLVFAAAKYIAYRSLRDLRVDFAQLPYALHRVQAE
jgi:adenine-specific DNA-methyltransferase